MRELLSIRTIYCGNVPTSYTCMTSYTPIDGTAMAYFPVTVCLDGRVILKIESRKVGIYRPGNLDLSILYENAKFRDLPEQRTLTEAKLFVDSSKVSFRGIRRSSDSPRPPHRPGSRRVSCPYLSNRPPSAQHPGRRQARHAHTLRIGLRLAIAQANAGPMRAQTRARTNEHS